MTHSPSLMMMTSILDPSPITIFWVWNFGNRSFFTRPLPFDLPAPLISMSNYVRCNCRSLIEAVKLAIISPTVTQLWNCSNSTVLGHFVTQNFCLHKLWNLLSFRMCNKASLTNRLWVIQNSLTQSWEIAILRKQDLGIFPYF